MIAATGRPPRSGRGFDVVPLAVTLSLALHLAILAGMLWWARRDIPAETPEQGVELMWDQPSQAAQAAGLAGDTALPEAPPSVAPPPPPAAEAGPEQPAVPPPPPPPPSLAAPSPPALARALPPPPLAAAPPQRPPAPTPLPPPDLPPVADAVLPPPPTLAPALAPPAPAQERAVAEARPEPPPPEPARPEAARPEAARPEPARPETPPRAEPPRPQRQAAPRPSPRPSPAAPPAAPAPAEAPAATQQGAGALATGATAPPSADPAARNLPPIYPPASRLRGEEGVVAMIVTIGPDGRPQAAQIIRGSGHVALDEEARRAVLNWRFRPALRNGEPVSGQIATNIRFTLH